MNFRGLLLIGALSAGAFAAEPLTLSLEQALAMAREKNVDVALARLNLQEFQSRYRQAIGGALPEIKLGAGYTHNFERPKAFFSGGKIETGIDNGFDASVTAEQPLYSGGKVLTGIRGARHALSAQENLVKGTEDEVVFAVRNLFYNALLSSATTGISQDNLTSTQDHLSTIQQRYKQGLDSDLTVERQQVNVSAAKATFISVRNLQELDLVSLQDTLSLDVDRPIQLIGSLAPPRESAPAYEDVSRIALAKHPGLKAARENREFYSHLIEVSQADMLPHLSLFGRYDWIAQANNFAPTSDQRAWDLSGGVRLNYPLFTGGDRLEKVRQAKVDYQRARERESQLERAVRVDVRRQWLAIAEALERARSQETAIDAARLALKAIETRYKAGQASLLDLNDATIALNQVRTRFILAAHDYWVSLAALERAIGGPLPGAKP